MMVLWLIQIINNVVWKLLFRRKGLLLLAKLLREFRRSMLFKLIL